MLSQPFRLIEQIFTPFGRTIGYVLGQWLPFAFVPAASGGAWAIAGFPLFKLFVAQGQSVLAINIRYAMTVVPGLCYGAILWWSVRPQVFKTPNIRRFWIFCLTLSVMVTIGGNPNRSLSFLIPDSIDPWVHVPLTRQWRHAGAIYPLLAQVPDEASVAATTYIIPHLSSRREILRFPQMELLTDAGRVERMEYILLDLWRLQTYQVAFRHDRARLAVMVPKLQRLTESGEYGILDWRDGVILLGKGQASEPAAEAAWEDWRSQYESENMALYQALD